MKIIAKVMAISVLVLLLAIPISANAEPEISGEISQEYILNIFNLNDIGNNQKTNHEESYQVKNFGGHLEVTEPETSDNQEDENKKVEPAPHPALDLPLNIGVFIFTTLTLSFILYVTKIRKPRKMNF